MVKRLRRRFVLTAALAVLIVLLLLVGTIYLFSCRRTASNADAIISILEANNGAFPDTAHFGGTVVRGGLSPETRFSTRFFAVTFAVDGSLASINMDSIAAVDGQEAVSMAADVLLSGKSRGYTEEYRYHVSGGDASVMVLFLDVRRDLDSQAAFLRTGLAVSGSAFALILGLLAALAGRAVRPIAESHEKQKRFITDAGHELKTPLSVISANTEVLELENGENEWTESIRHQVERLSKLTDDLVTLSRMDEMSEKPQMAEFALSDAVCEAAEMFVLPSETAGKSFDMDIQQDLSYNGNEDMLRRLTGILLDNALKYSTGRVRLSLRRDKKIMLTVSNAVDGLPAGEHSELFERFYRADKSRNSATGGHGIGLSIAKAIVLAHHGKITAVSDGDELTITVTL